MTTIDRPLSAGHDASRLPDQPTGRARRYALVAGMGYVVLFALGVFANFFVREGLIVADDATTTAANIAESEALFRGGMVAFLVIFIVDVVVAWALYMLFKKANEGISLVTAWFRIVYTVFLGVAVVFFFQALQLLSRSESLAVFTTEQLNAQALVALDTFNTTWLIGLLAFGVHLVLLGALVINSRWAPRALGYVLIVAGLAYVADTVAHTLVGNYVDYETVFLVIVAVPSVIAEGWFGIWLLLKGGKNEMGGPTRLKTAAQVLG